MNQKEYTSYLNELNERESKLKKIDKKFKKLNRMLNKAQAVRDEALNKLLSEEQEIDSIKRLLEL